MPKVLELLAKLLNQLWRNSEVPAEWCRANGAYIPKEKAEKLSQFRPISSMFNVEGKIFFSVVAARLTDFLSNGYINISVQKAGVPGFPGCLEHVSMIWAAIMEAK